MGKDLERLIVNTFIIASPEKRRWAEQRSEERTRSIDTMLCGCFLLLFISGKGVTQLKKISISTEKSMRLETITLGPYEPHGVQ